MRIIQLLKAHSLAIGTDVDKVALQTDQLTIQKAIIKSKLEQVMQALKFSMGISPDRTIEIENEIIFSSGENYTLNPTLDFQIAATQNSTMKIITAKSKKDLFCLKKVSVFQIINLLESATNQTLKRQA